MDMNIDEAAIHADWTEDLTETVDELAGLLEYLLPIVHQQEPAEMATLLMEALADARELMGRVAGDTQPEGVTFH